jgi:hypothetical protein
MAVGSRRRPLSLGALALLLLSLSAGTPARGQDVGSRAAADDGPILHEYVAPPGGAARAGTEPADRPRTIGGEPRAGKNPAAVKSNDQLLPEPPKTKAAEDPDGRDPGGAEVVHGTGDFGADRDTTQPMDRQTGGDSTLHYSEVFNPSVVPFKRMSALDAVSDDYVLRVHDQRLVELPVGGKGVAGRDMFWASLLVELEPGKNVPIPSTAPDMRILSYEADPALPIRFLKDGADNYYVRSDDRRAGGTVRLVFLSDAPVSYFAPTLPRGYTLSDAAASGLVRPVPERARRAAEVVFDKLHVSRDQAYDQALGRLIEYFRGFEAGDPPPTTDDLYLDLALSQRGVCRHRAFAFTITANALGIPARFVSNEAHAFAEVWVPAAGWVRVDLGGTALNLDVANAGDKQLYRPRGDDPFPKPPAYRDNYTQLRGDIRGLTQAQIDAGRRTPMLSPGPGQGQGGAPTPSRPTDPVAPSPGTGLPAPPPEAYQGKTATKIMVADAEATGFRGENVRVSGVVTDAAGKPVAGVPVNIYLAPAGRSGDDARLVGDTVTDGEGRWQADLSLPADLPLGRHEVFASTPGDKNHQPALSQ